MQLRIGIRDIEVAPEGKEVKPFKIGKLSEILHVPEIALRTFLKPGTLVELSIETPIMDGLKYFRME
jgi:hypothetical protein